MTYVHSIHVRHLKQAKMYLKTGFNVLFTAECLNRHDRWHVHWIAKAEHCPVCLRCHQSNRSVMFGVGIVGVKLVGPWHVPDRLKMVSQVYIILQKDNFNLYS